jgi:carbon storage regulator
MLVLNRSVDETIEVGKAGDVLVGPITVTLVRIKGKQVRIGVDADPSISVHRGEVVEQRRAAMTE